MTTHESSARPATPAEPVALDLRDHVVFDQSEPALVPVARAERLGLDVVCLEPRQTLPAVTLDADRLYTVVGGRAWAVVEDAEVTLDPLQAVLVPAGTAHGIRNDSADPLILQVVTSPPGRETRLAAAQRAAAKRADPRDDRSSKRFSRVRRILGSG